jgi:pimeloyl-ACP methyl ester carboxylesterase
VGGAAGASPRPVETVALDLHELGIGPGQFSFVEQVGKLLPAILVGNSFGGRVALETALAFGDRVPGLVLVDPATGSRHGIGARRSAASVPSGVARHRRDACFSGKAGTLPAAAKMTAARPAQEGRGWRPTRLLAREGG